MAAKSGAIECSYSEENGISVHPDFRRVNQTIRSLARSGVDYRSSGVDVAAQKAPLSTAYVSTKCILSYIGFGSEIECRNSRIRGPSCAVEFISWFAIDSEIAVLGIRGLGARNPRPRYPDHELVLAYLEALPATSRAARVQLG